MAADAVGECCISLLRQDKTRQAKTGQACLFVSQPPRTTLLKLVRRKNGDLPYRRRIPRGLLVGSSGQFQRKGDGECAGGCREARELQRRKQNKPRGREGTRKWLGVLWGKDEAEGDPRETMRPLTSVAASGCSSLLLTQALQASQACISRAG